MEARSGRTAAPAAAVASTGSGPVASHWLRWGAMAAAVLAGLGLAYFVFMETSPFGGQPAAVVQAAEEGLFRVDATQQLLLNDGDEVAEGDLIRTGREGGAVVRLADGSLVEMRDRSEISIDESRRGTTIELRRGSVIVEAADQRDRHLWVATDDCLVAVTGTIFSVNSGTKGSRVSVIEGEVRVEFSGDEAVLRPGDQVVAGSHLGPVPVDEEIAWSRSVDEYVELLQEFDALRDELTAVRRPDARYTSRLLDLMPEGTIFYAAVPNLGETVAEYHRLIQERVDENPVLAEWWQSQGSQDFQAEVDRVVAELGEVGSYLGDELAVGGAPNFDEHHGGNHDDSGQVAVLADVVDAAGLTDYLVTRMTEWSDGEAELVFVEDPALAGAASGDAVYVWMTDDLFAASPDLGTLVDVAASVGGESNPFVGTDFHQELAALYDEGTEIVVAVDIAGVFANANPAADHPDHQEALARLGVLDARHLIAEQKRLGGNYQHRAVMSFSNPRRGVASWLAEPAPMGSLDFISPDAKLVTAMVFKDPAALLDDLQSLNGEGDEGGFGTIFQGFEEEYGLSIRDDFAGVLGGEVAFAVDGPLLPDPAWKMVLEVYDPARFQWVVEQAVAEANDRLRAEGQKELELLEEMSGSRTYYTLRTPLGEIADVHYTFAHGFFVSGPNRALLDRAIRFRETGLGITDSARFTSLLPADGQANFSALVYQDLAAVARSVAEKLGSGRLTDEQSEALDAMAATNKPTLGYAYGEPQRIVVATSSETDVMGGLLMQLLGLRNPAGLGQVMNGILGS